MLLMTPPIGSGKQKFEAGNEFSEIDSSLRDSIKKNQNSTGLVASYSNRQRKGNTSSKPIVDYRYKKSQNSGNVRKSKFVKKTNFKQNSSYS